MNISEAKAQLKSALISYFTKDEFGNFRIPAESQRPVFLMGPPGIGKTAIVRQVAEEMGVGIVSYSITHHTRQSALGLPMIVTKEYGGIEYHVSEYTMSEIIAAVYDVIEDSGATEGILFLDEVNCASETLTPVMLQFLQFKTFGRHKLPDGWVVVTAGNPTEFNRNAREFDIVTWDRLKRIDVEADYPAWKLYASERGVHGAVLSYLDIKRENFYKLNITPDGMRFVTARGWVDLSDMIKLYEENGIAVSVEMTSQYIQDREISEDFAAYYELYNKYRSDYRIEEILNGEKPDDMILRAREAAFDERLSLLGLLISSIGRDFRSVIDQEDVIAELLPILRTIRSTCESGGSIEEAADEMIENERSRMVRLEKRGILTAEKRLRSERVTAFLAKAKGSAATENGEQGFSAFRSAYEELLGRMREDAAHTSERLKALFGFANSAFGSGDELLILVTELTSNRYSARFISRYGSEEYHACSEELAFHQRHIKLAEEMEGLEIPSDLSLDCATAL